MRSLWLFFLIFLVGCQQAPARGGKPRIVATTGMVADLVRNVAGDGYEVEQLFAADVDPHQYKANTADVRTLAQADLIFYSGLHLEGKMVDLLERLGKERPSVAIAESLERGKLLVDGAGHADPHVWFDVALWSGCTGVIAETLARHDPAHEADYRGRAQAYQQTLAKLDEEVRAKLAAIPKERRVLVTSHDAFRYFGRAYDIDVRGVQGISTEGEASVLHVNQLVQFIAERGVKAVFVETSVNPRNIEALIEGCQARGHKVRKGGELFSDAMGELNTPEGTYPGMIRANVDVIVKALQ